MKATSTALFEAEAAGQVGALEQIRSNVWVLPLAMPMAHLPSVLSYLIVDDGGGVHVVDPGWDSDENWQRVLDALSRIGSSPDRVVSATMTHLHQDHIGMAQRYREHTPARLQISRIDQQAIDADPQLKAQAAHAQLAGWGVPDDRLAEVDVSFATEADTPPVRSDVLLNDGDDLGVEGAGIRVVLTPGHTSGSICLACADQSLLLTGDHVLPTIFSGLGLGALTTTNPVTDYLASLDALSEFDEFEVLPGHGYRFTGLAERRAELAEHHLRRSREAADILADDPSASVWSVASRLHWTAGWPNLHGPMLRSALAQTSWHMQRAR